MSRACSTRSTYSGKVNLDLRHVRPREPLKALGDLAVPVKLHKDVTAHLKVVIEKEAVAE